MRSAILGCAALLLWTTGAYAQDSGFYLGGGITRTSLDTSSDFVQDAPDFSLDDDDNGWKLIAGIRPLDWLAVEGNYVDFGGVNAGNDALGGEYELTGFDVFAVGFLSAPFVDVFGKVGAIRWDADGRVNFGGVSFSDSESGTDLAYGAGVQARFGSLAGRLEYERFEVDGTDEVAMLTLGVTFTFL
ncbi:MAG TPA: outer membrane beta-barrel protein [Woeseiaceae bacterium]|nr:outer membrane beta-barrel protein [Woeseiaceae bacterium]